MACAPAMDEFDQASVKALAQSNQFGRWATLL